MSDIVERLRDRDAVVMSGLFHAIPAMQEAAAEIERLRSRLEFEQRCHRIATETRVKFENEIFALRAQVEEATRVIKGVVTSYPVAAGTSKYGYEEEHDGYGSIRECRLFLEKIAALPSTVLPTGDDK